MSKINIILLGQSGVGKTSILMRLKTGEFTEVCPVTHAVEFHVKKIYLCNKEINIFLWDTSGQEKYNTVVKSYYRQGDGVLLVYDVTHAPSFYTLSKWLCDIKDMNEKAEILIAGNKNEDPTKKAVAVSMVKNFAKQENLEYTEMSAMSGENVEEAFLYLARKILLAKGIIQDCPGGLSLPGSTTDSLEERNSLQNDRDQIEPADSSIRLGETPAGNGVQNQTSSCC